jgi:hypothetical protein
VLGDLAYLRDAAHLVHHDLRGRKAVHRRRHDLQAPIDRHHSELAGRTVGEVAQVAHQRTPAILEDVQRQHQAREEHGPQREQR